MSYAVLFANSIAHFLVDAVCAATIFSCGGDLSLLIPVYNTLAFSTQCLVGLAADRLKSHGILTAVGCMLVALGFFLPVQPLIKIVIVGLGNSLFHVCGGTVTLKMSGGRAAPLGVFVAPGAIGLVIGTMYPDVGIWLAIALCACAAAVAFIPTGECSSVQEKSEKNITPLWIPAILLIAVAVRAVGGTVVTFPWKNTAALSILTVLFVWAGKTAGGFVCDRLGAKNTALLSIPVAALCIAFGSGYIAASLAGQLLLNLTMPVTLWLIYKAMPDSPGFAFGLAASALWPGTLMGQLMTLTGPALWICVLLSFLFGLAAILIAQRKMKTIGAVK